MKALNPTYGKYLDHYSRLVIQVSETLKDIYWTKNKQFNGAKALYSDAIDDYFWTLVEQIEVDNKSEFLALEKKVGAFFNKIKKQYSFYLTPFDRQRRIHQWLQELGYHKKFEDNFMFLENPQLDNYKQPPSANISVTEVKTLKDNETYITVYTKAYTSNPDDAYYDFGSEGVYENIYRESWKNPIMRKKMRKFIGFYKGNPAWCGAIYFQDKLVYIAEVGTDNQFRRKGLAKNVSLACINAGIQQGCKTLLLGTEKNSPAEKLYLSLGFQPKTTFWGMVKNKS